MNIEEIIPFLIFVFWIVRSIITQKRKAEEQRKRAPKSAPKNTYSPDYSEPKPKRQPPILFEAEEPEIDILEELFGNKKEKKQVSFEPVNQPVTKTESRREKELKEKKIALQMKREYEKEKLDFKRETAKSFELKQIHVASKSKIARSKSTFGRFDLKKAVIFSEILKRPYE